MNELSPFVVIAILLVVIFYLTAERSQFIDSLPPGSQWFIAVIILLFIAAVALLPGTGQRPNRHNQAMQASRVIGQAMSQYAVDHNGTYPTGKSSTEIFQKLLDGGYITDPDVFSGLWPGKTKATSNTLKPENVCFDVTIPIQDNSSDFLPEVFSTGYRIEYVPGGKAVPLPSSGAGRPDGIAIFYHGNNAWFMNSGVNNGASSNGTIPNVISPNFDPASQHYQQLTPTGPLPP